MDITALWEELNQPGDRIVYVVLDGGGGLAGPDGRTALEQAKTPNLDRLADQGSCGLLEPIGPGITAGSGPGHLALFGYDPLRFRIGRGVLSALGIDFDLQPGDVAARVNFASCDETGAVRDRRAGRIATEVNRQLCQKIREQLELPFDGEAFLETVSEHRAVLVLRGEGLGGEINDSDPQAIGRRPRELEGADAKSDRTADLVTIFLDQAAQVLDGETANCLLLRGFQRFDPLPSLYQRFGLRGLCLARYPMYRGLSRLLGMDVVPRPADSEEMVTRFVESFEETEHDLIFLHFKATDKAGEDSDFPQKVALIEQIDEQLARVMATEPDVLVVTSDHSTPASMGAHSWHPVPVVIHGRYARRDPVSRFDEFSCGRGILGLRPGIHLMGLAMANARRLRKFGA